MAYNTEMMTPTEVSSQAINDNYFDTAYFDKYILTSQRKYIKPVLGVKYYDELLTQIAGASLTGDNTIIVNQFIKPMLAHYVVYEVYSKIHTQLTNQGAMENNTEQSSQASNFEYSQSLHTGPFIYRDRRRYDLKWNCPCSGISFGCG